MVEVAPKVNVVCMDATHGTNGNAYYLVSLLVKAQTGKGCPVGHCICTREDTDTLTVFLNEVCKKCGHPILVDYFMSDMARAYYNAWCNTMHKTTDPPNTKPASVNCRNIEISYNK